MSILLRKQSSVENLVLDLETLRQVDVLASQERGDLTTLTTFNKNSLVQAINEVNAESDLNRDFINSLNIQLGGSQDGPNGWIFTELNTEADTIIDGINEIEENFNALESDTLRKSDNLASLVNKNTSRTNLNVYSKEEVQTLINSAELALGSNYSVANIASRDLLEDLTVGDNVFITDAGDGKWAIDKVIAVVGDIPTFERIMDEDVYLNAISASALKASYESNDDTNAFDDLSKSKVDNITSTIAINLDNAFTSDNSISDGTLTGADHLTGVTSLAVKEYVDDFAISVAGNFEEFSGNVIKQEAAHVNLDVYSRATVDDKIQNIELVDPVSGQSIDIGDMIQVVSDMEKAKKNFFFGLDLLGGLKS